MSNINTTTTTIPRKVQARIQRLTEAVNLVLKHIPTSTTTTGGVRGEELSFADELTNLIKLVVENDLDKRNKDKNSLAAAIIYTVARKLNLPITLQDVVYIKQTTTSLKGIREKDITRMYRIIVKHLNIAVPVIDYRTRIERIAYNLEQRYSFTNIKEDWEAAKADSIRLLEEYSANGKLRGKDPTCYAAAALYMSLLDYGIHISQKDLADAAFISAVALRFAYSYLRKLR
ncbi:MAG: hypothetical protein QXI43_00205 [Candidatus Nitrosocaldus sp.]